VQKGATFDCEVSMDGAKRQVTVTITGDDGTYEVGRPK
jgi:VCBS repeat-containing protein